MTVAVMNIRIMRMAVHQRPVNMDMGMRFGAVPREIVRVPMMRIVRVRVPVRQGFVFV